MPLIIETYRTSLSKWWNPKTWGGFKEEKVLVFRFDIQEWNEFISGLEISDFLVNGEPGLFYNILRGK